MAAFVQEVVKDLIAKQTDFAKTTIVVPGKRPIVFLIQEFREQLKNSMLPRVVSIEDWIAEVAQMQKINTLKAWTLGFTLYKNQQTRLEDFESFLKWFPTLLIDFNDLDSALANSKQLFDYLISAERIEKWNLQPELVAKNKMMQNHLLFWETASQLYQDLTAEFQKKRFGTNGFLLKTAVSKIKAYLQSNQDQFIWVGFNAMTNAEQNLLQTLRQEKRVTTYWQADDYYLKDKNQEAGHFLRAQQEKEKNFSWSFQDFNQTKKIEAIGVAKSVSQVKFVHDLLQNFSEEELQNTALVLADEHILISLINSLPKKLKKANITMGIALKNSPLAELYLSYFDLHLNREKIGKSKAFYHKDVYAILQQNKIALSAANQQNIQELITKIQANNSILIPAKTLQEFTKNTIFASWFALPNSTKETTQFLLQFTQDLIGKQQNALNQQVLQKMQSVLLGLQQEIQSLQSEDLSLKTVQFLLVNLLKQERISLIGEPLAGLQISGLLETRLLNFKNVIILSANEGVLPLGRTDNSMIPYDIRKQFGLNTYKENDAIFAYHFYRLIQKSNSIYLIYNTEAEGLSSGEKSRFIRQLEQESKHNIQQYTAKTKLQSKNNVPIVVAKNKAILNRLFTWSAKGISASALNDYLRNPIDFYKKKVLQLDLNDSQTEDSINPMDFGNLIHECLEELYTPIVNQILNAKILQELKQLAPTLVSKKFQQQFGKFYKQGRNLLALNVATRMVNSVINQDLKLVQNNELVVLGVEEKFKLDFATQNHKNLKLFGIVDRIDSLNQQVRIIDYKTGAAQSSDLNLSTNNLSSVFSTANKSKALQLLVYCFLVFGNKKYQMAEFGIQSLRYPNRGFMPLLYNKSKSITQENQTEFLPYFYDLIDEILNPNLNFVENQS